MDPRIFWQGYWMVPMMKTVSLNGMNQRNDSCSKWENRKWQKWGATKQSTLSVKKDNGRDQMKRTTQFVAIVFEWDCYSYLFRLCLAKTERNAVNPTTLALRFQPIGAGPLETDTDLGINNKSNTVDDGRIIDKKKIGMTHLHIYGCQLVDGVCS